jgi:hypothetical protein
VFDVLKLGRSAKVIVLILLLGSGIFLIGTITSLSAPGQILNPGFEGAKCYLNYVNFRNTFPSGWNGVAVNHYLAQVNDKGNVVNNGETGHFISNDAGNGIDDYVFWSSRDLSNPTVDHHADWLLNHGDFSLRTDIQSNLPLADLDRNGVPLSGTTSTLMLNYPIITNQVQNPDGSFTYNVTNQKLILVPVDFVIQFSITSQPSSFTGTKLSEGDWKNVELGFMLYWNTWQSSFLNAISQDSYKPNIPADASNKNTYGSYLGGFPITAWVGGWDPTVLPSTRTDPISQFLHDPLYFYKGNTPQDTLNQDLLQKLGTKVSVSPDLTGHTIDLYSDQNQVVASKNSMGTNAPDSLEATSQSRAPDPSMTLAQYFTINILELGTLFDGNMILGWTLYYPSTYMRVHVVYGVYGSYTYLWTTKTEQEQNYPGFENRTMTIIHGAGAFDWLNQIFSNPLFWLMMLLGGLIVLIVLLAIFAPGVLALGSAVAKRGAEKVSKGGRKGSKSGSKSKRRS